MYLDDTAQSHTDSVTYLDQYNKAGDVSHAIVENFERLEYFYDFWRSDSNLHCIKDSFHVTDEQLSTNDLWNRCVVNGAVFRQLRQTQLQHLHLTLSKSFCMRHDLSNGTVQIIQKHKQIYHHEDSDIQSVSHANDLATLIARLYKPTSKYAHQKSHLFLSFVWKYYHSDVAYVDSLLKKLVYSIAQRKVNF